jgi:hypothetical protein
LVNFIARKFQIERLFLEERVEREFVTDNLLVRTRFIIVMIRWTSLAPREFEFPFPGSLASTFLERERVSLPEQRGCVSHERVEAITIRIGPTLGALFT